MGDNSYSLGVVYLIGPTTVNGELKAESGEANFSAGLYTYTISVKGVLTAAVWERRNDIYGVRRV